MALSLAAAAAKNDSSGRHHGVWQRWLVRVA